MGFTCSEVLQDIDIYCDKNIGGIHQVLLCKQDGVFIDRDPLNEKIITLVQVLDPVIIEFNDKDGETSFSEAKSESNGLPVVSTNIVIQNPAISENLNKLYTFKLRNDLVAILFHNNSSVTISGVDYGLNLTYEADSGSSISEKSYVNIILTGESSRSSIVLDDDTIFEQINSWNNITSVWNNITNSWNNY